MKKLRVSSSTVQFRIDVDFPDAEVDMVYKEITTPTPVPPPLTDKAKIEIDVNKLPDTPTEASVNFCLHWLAGFVDRNEMCTESSKWDKDYSKPMITITPEDGSTSYNTFPSVKTELEEIEITVESWYGLMMGTCHLICEVDSDKYSPQLVAKANKIVEEVFSKYVQFYDIGVAV